MGLQPGLSPLKRAIGLGLLALLASTGGRAVDQPPPGTAVIVRDAAGLRQAIATAQPGTRILLAPGDYAGGLYFSSLHGAPGNPILIGAQDPTKPPILRATENGLQISGAAYLELRDL